MANDYGAGKDELPPLPLAFQVPPPGPMPLSPPARETHLAVPTFGRDTNAPNSQTPAMTPRSFSSLAVPSIHTPGSEADYDLMHELHEATSSPTPIHEILRDPGILTSLLAGRKKRRPSGASSHRERSASGPCADQNLSPPVRSPRENSRSRSREPAARDENARAEKAPRSSKKERERERESDSASILTHVLAEEERQARHLKAVLRQTGIRLEMEIRRADGSEARARAAEFAAQDAGARCASAEAARHHAEVEAARAQEETKRHQMAAETAEREVRRVQAEMQRLERVRAEAEKSAAEAREAARKAQLALREYHAREEGREEVRRLEVRRRYNDGRDHGFEDGRAEGYEAGHADGFEAGREEGFEAGRAEGHSAGRLTGFEEGKKAGNKEGYEAGLAAGRKEERSRALEAFDRFLDAEMDDRRSVDSYYTHDERTQRWVDATRRAREQTPPPPPSAPLPIPGPPLGTATPRPGQGLVSPPPPPFQPIHVYPRDPSPPPKLVWLHRPLNHPAPGRDAGGLARPLPVVPESPA